MAKGKTYNEKYGSFDREQEYDPRDAIARVKDFQRAKFDETVEVHIRTGLNVRHAEEQLRGTITFPKGLGKAVKVAVFAKGDAASDAETAGADYVGAEDLAKKMEEGLSDFDVVIATPDMMPVVGGLGRVLGPMGKMPNPKVGTVTPNVADAVKNAKAGQVQYRTDKSGIVQCTIGRASFTEDALKQNFLALIDALNKARPANTKGIYLKKVSVSSTMGPGVKVDQASLGGQQQQ